MRPGVEHAKCVSCDIINVSDGEVGLLPIIYYPIDGWFKSFHEDAEYYCVESWQEGDGPEVANISDIFMLLGYEGEHA